MTNEEVIQVLNKINPFNDNSKMQEYFESVEIAINSIQENTKLKAEIEELKGEVQSWKDIAHEEEFCGEYGTDSCQFKHEMDKAKAEIERLKERLEIKDNNFELYSNALDEIDRLNNIISQCNKISKEIVLIAEQLLKGETND